MGLSDQCGDALATPGPSGSKLDRRGRDFDLKPVTRWVASLGDCRQEVGVGGTRIDINRERNKSAPKRVVEHDRVDWQVAGAQDREETRETAGQERITSVFFIDIDARVVSSNDVARTNGKFGVCWNDHAGRGYVPIISQREFVRRSRRFFFGGGVGGERRWSLDQNLDWRAVARPTVVMWAKFPMAIGRRGRSRARSG